MILTRYLIKEILYTWFATTAILMLIFMSTQFVHYLTGAAIGRYAAELLFKIMLFQVPILLGLLIPVGFYGAILMAYGRLYADREMVVLGGCGFSAFQLLRITFIVAFFVFIVTSIFSLWLSPKAAATQKKMIEDARNAPPIETLMPGRFFTTPDGRYVLFVDQISTDHHYLRKLFLAEHLPAKPNMPDHYAVVTAQEGKEVIQPDGQKYLVISQGNRYDGIPGQGNYQVDHFAQYGLQLAEKGSTTLKNDPQMMSTKALFDAGMKHPAVAAELQWRLSSPLSVFILALLAIPLSRVNPRQGRFAQIIPATLIYIIYANMMFMDRAWVENSTIPAWLGMWWLHMVMLILAGTLLFKQERLWARLRHWWAS